MDQEITLAQLRQWLIAYAERIKSQELYLTELDAAIGDADHGANMRRGTRRICERMAEPDFHLDDISAFLRAVAMTLISSVGGAAGPLYGAFFMRAAQVEQDNDTLTLAELATMFRAGLEGILQRGKAQVGDKTMIDALQPAVEALEDAAQQGLALHTALEAARFSAEKGMHKTIDMQANRGRASYLGPRAIGHQDPGATSLYYLIETAADTLVAPENAKNVQPAAPSGKVPRTK
jgi:phosphoenolpyruvate---glycerone phosphotransferase subunit DhaL